MWRTTFKTVHKARTQAGGEAAAAGGEKKQSAAASFALMGHNSVPELIADMDRLGYDIIVITATEMWSYYYHHKLIIDHTVDSVGQIVQEAKGRVIGAASYNPFRIEDSLKDIERGVKEYGFKYVWFHPISFGVAPNDRRCYPLYAKCNELDIAVGLQVGHSAEVLPSDLLEQINAAVRDLMQPAIDQAMSRLGEEAEVALRITLQDLVEQALREELQQRSDLPPA